ncbi:glycerol ethanol, ferric requiring protein [Coemansia sp. RSA 2611]|nr:glycerol ethanol, ferric requiring protein [Coemansia sp. RSA 2705]KAJ2322318.1 glycerol ethanol, ferric requiring protein [Coemansia sp. RSA 2704]KAJ2370458.1 glycerol ethanol, ferric requiring protein [Coemansia sp. RSA 2610]KAJ2393686.1 glycerol ethanol, ferric requiring protein [Coemansia sp. RSA 2611]KAJ2739904.1 glycerol ethanol, ferric requiring protein [Coemansia sp. Cherry 401B]
MGGSTARFDEFDTVDWITDAARERERQHERRYEVGRTLLLRRAYDAVESWVVVLIVGVLIGVNTAMISIVTEWLSDAKLGVCSQGWWLNEKFCCWMHDESAPACPAWVTWDHYLGVDAAFVRWAAFVAMGTAFATTCALLVRELAPLAAGSGLPEIKAILGGFVIRGFMGAWTLVMKSVGLALAVASGLSIGKEGPAVHMGCCVGNVVSRNFARYRRSAARQREIVSASAAAGVAVAFGAPIGGVLFSMEDLSSRFPRKTMWRSFFCALIATVSLQAMDPFWTGKLVMFQASYDRDWHFFELLFFAIIGVFGGVYGGLCIKLNLRVTAFRKKHLSTRAVEEVAVLAAATTAVTYLNTYTREDMGELLSYLLQECHDNTKGWNGICVPANAWRVAWGLAAATLIRAAGTVLAYGCKVPCGIFVPSMAIGASFGRLVGTLAEIMQRSHPDWRLFSQCAPDTPCITPATYAFLGAAAAMCGVTKVTVAVVVIMYELTGALNFLVPTVIVVMIARTIGDAIVEGGISEQLILLNGIPFLEEANDSEHHGDDGQELLDMPVATLMRGCDENMLVLYTAGMVLNDLWEFLRLSPKIHGYPVLDNEQDMRLVGYVLYMDIIAELRIEGLMHGDGVVIHTISFDPSHNRSTYNFKNFGHIVDTSPVTVRPRTSAETTVEIFRKLGPRAILVTSEEDGRLEGMLTRKDVLRHIRNQPDH